MDGVDRVAAVLLRYILLWCLHLGVAPVDRLDPIAVRAAHFDRDRSNGDRRLDHGLLLQIVKPV